MWVRSVHMCSVKIKTSKAGSMLNKHVHLVEQFLQVLSSCSRSAPPLSLKFSEVCSVIVCYLWWDVPLEVRMNGEDTAPENRRLGPRKKKEKKTCLPCH